MKREIRLILPVALILVVSFLSSCATRVGMLKTKSRKEAVIEKINEYNDKIKDVKAKGTIILRHKGSIESFRLELFNYETPEFVRINLKDFIFKKPLLTLISNNDKVMIYNFVKKEKKEYMDLSHFFKELLGFEINPDYIEDIFVMRIPLLKESGVKKTVEGSERVILEGPDNSEIITLAMNNNNILPEKIEYRTKKYMVNIKYGKIVDLDYISMPSNVKVEIDGNSFEINYSSIDIHSNFNKDYLKPPF